MSTPFFNNDERLRTAAAGIIAERHQAGLDGLVGGLTGVILNTEPECFQPAVEEILRYTGFAFHDAFETPETKVCVLTCPGSADLLVTTRLVEPNPFSGELYPKSKHLPNTRVETFLFTVPDLERYVAIQRQRGIHFLTPAILDRGGYRFIQTLPSPYTGNSIGFIEWRGTRGQYRPVGSRQLAWTPVKPALPHLGKIGYLDHAATRVRAEDRDPAILEFMTLTNYNFTMAIYVEALNSITNVARLPGETFALVFTSGVSPYVNDKVSGPTEKFIHAYGPRVHHLAFYTDEIDATYAALGRDGMEFLVELVGSPEEGLKQTFSVASPYTLVVNEYIYRYGGFDGFFTKSNVARLTEVTGRQ